MEPLNFAGENIYVGFDVHKKDWKVTIMSDQVIHKTFAQPPNPEILVNYLTKNFPGATYHSAYEAGFSGFWIHNRLAELGVKSMVVNPADIPTTQKEKVHKEDKRDSRKIARSLRNNELKAIYIPTTRTLEDRSLVRMRNAVVSDLKRFKQRIKSFLFFYGIFIPEAYQGGSGYWSKRFINWLESIELNHRSGKEALGLLIKESQSIRKTILEVTHSIGQLAKSDHYRDQMSLLRSIPGIGLLTGMTILTEIECIERFSNIDQLCSYIGLIPTTSSSGEKEQHGGITFRGNHGLRKMLIESSWVAVRIDPALMKAYLDYCKRMDSNKAIIRIARKLTSRIQFVLKNKQSYKLLTVK
jgi:transposase